MNSDKKRMNKYKIKYFSMTSRKEWMDDCCWREINQERDKCGGYVDQKLHICRECDNKIITERKDIIKEHDYVEA